MAGLYRDFFGDFSLDGVIVKSSVIGIEKGYFIIYWVYMAAYADRSVADESCFAGSPAADIGKVLTVTAHYDIRDKLLTRWVLFGLWAGHEVQDGRVEEDRKITVHIGCQAMEKTYLLKDLSLDYKYLLILCHDITPIFFTEFPLARK